MPSRPGRRPSSRRKLNPQGALIVARAHSDEEGGHLESLGADVVILGEREIGLGMVDVINRDSQAGGRNHRLRGWWRRQLAPLAVCRRAQPARSCRADPNEPRRGDRSGASPGPAPRCRPGRAAGRGLRLWRGAGRADRRGRDGRARRGRRASSIRSSCPRTTPRPSRRFAELDGVAPEDIVAAAEVEGTSAEPVSPAGAVAGGAGARPGRCSRPTRRSSPFGTTATIVPERPFNPEVPPTAEEEENDPRRVHKASLASRGHALFLRPAQGCPVAPGMISQKAKYALRALVALCKVPPGDSLMISGDLARRRRSRRNSSSRSCSN